MENRTCDASHFDPLYAEADLVVDTSDGTPLEVICAKFKGMRFEPSGMTKTHNIRVAKSPVDYIARWLELKFLQKEIL